MTTKRYRYIGKERDDESGFYYMGARYYCPWMARWLAPDPINGEWYNQCKGVPQRNRERDFMELTCSSYEYCYANPVRFIDPNGEQVTWRNDEATNRRMITAGQNAWQSTHPGVSIPQPRSPDVLRADMFGRGYAGSEATVNAKINAVRNEYYNKVSDAIISGPFAAYGMLTNGSEGALKWSHMDQLVMSYAGAGTPYGVTQTPKAGVEPSYRTSEPLGAREAKGTGISGDAADVSNAASGSKYLFRGTSVGYAGNSSLQRLGLTPTSESPAVAAVFATNSEAYGKGIVMVVNPNKVGNAISTESNVLSAMEQEVVLNMKPVDFANIADKTTTVSHARDILGTMGINIPSKISNGEIDAVLKNLPQMTPHQINYFYNQF